MFERLTSLFKRDSTASFDALVEKATPAELSMLSRMVTGQKERNFIEFRLGVPIQKFGDFSGYMETGCKKVWATFRSCRIIASTIVSAEFKVIREGNGKTEVDVTKKYGMFLKRPNPFDSWEEMVEMWSFHMELTGNAYWLKDQIDLKGRPLALYPLLPQYVRVVPDAANKIAKYTYHVNGRELTFLPEEIIHFRSVHPNNLIMGMGSIEPSSAVYSEYVNKSALQEKFIENGAQLSGVLTRETEVDDEESWKAFKKKFNLEYAGKGNSGKVAFLNGKWNYHKLGMTMAEMQALEKEKWTIEQIFLNHGVPLSIAGIDGAANYATARQDEINFRKYKIVSMIDILCGKINSDGFIDGKESPLMLTYEMSGLVDIEQVVKEYKPLVELGAMTLNELREMCNLPVVPNPLLDAFYVNSSRVPLELAGQSNPTDDELVNPDDPNATPEPSPSPEPAPPKKPEPKKP